jgi:hypothetical protein
MGQCYRAFSSHGELYPANSPRVSTASFGEFRGSGESEGNANLQSTGDRYRQLGAKHADPASMPVSLAATLARQLRPIPGCSQKATRFLILAAFARSLPFSPRPTVSLHCVCVTTFYFPKICIQEPISSLLGNTSAAEPGDRPPDRPTAPNLFISKILHQERPSCRNSTTSLHRTSLFVSYGTEDFLS